MKTLNKVSRRVHRPFDGEGINNRRKQKAPTARMEPMSEIADWIREATEKRRERWRKESRQQGIEEGRKQGRLEALWEIYGADYLDSQDRVSDHFTSFGKRD